jgi:predicted phosphodiesterase
MNDRILVIPDMHHPYAHPGTVDFLADVRRKYKPTRVIILGDEVDGHALSFHPKDPDLCSGGDELHFAVEHLRPIYKMFPKADILESNHGSLMIRRAVDAGISRKYIRTYRDVLDAPTGWHWHPSLILTSGERRVFFHHGIAKDVMRVVNRRGINVVQGHFHTEFGVWYSGNPGGDLWGMSAGCLIDTASHAFLYNATHLERPVLGCGMIIDGFPLVAKMEPG